MTSEELTRKEEDRLYAMSSIPFLIIFFVTLIYYSFFRLEEIYPPGAPFEPVMWDMLPRFFLPMLTMAPITFFLTFEILYHRKIKKPLKFHVKRFTGRMVILLTAVALFSAIYIFSYFVLSPLISARYALLCTLIIWSLTFYAIITKFRGFFSKLEKGE